MNSALPKVLLPLQGKPLLFYVLKAALDSGLNRIIIVVGRGHEEVKKTFACAKVEFVLQNRQSGTADAVKTCEKLIANDEEITVLCGDTPLLTAPTIKRLIEIHRQEKADATVLTTILANPYGYGRIVRDSKKQVIAIVEEREASDEIKRIKEINSGAFTFNWQRLKPVLQELKPSPRTGEYYLTDAIAALKATGAKIAAYVTPNCSEILGVNTPKEFEAVAQLLAKRNGKS